MVVLDVDAKVIGMRAGLGYYRDTYGQAKIDAAVVEPVAKLPDVKMRQSLASATLLVNVANVDEGKSSIDFQESSVSVILHPCPTEVMAF